MGRVEVATLGMLKARLPKGMTVSAGQTVAQAVEVLALARNEGIVPLVNGRLASWDTVLVDGDLLELVQSAGGG